MGGAPYPQAELPGQAPSYRPSAGRPGKAVLALGRAHGGQMPSGAMRTAIRKRDTRDLPFGNRTHQQDAPKRDAGEAMAGAGDAGAARHGKAAAGQWRALHGSHFEVLGAGHRWAMSNSGGTPEGALLYFYKPCPTRRTPSLGWIARSYCGWPAFSRTPA